MNDIQFQFNKFPLSKKWKKIKRNIFLANLFLLSFNITLQSQNVDTLDKALLENTKRIENDSLIVPIPEVELSGPEVWLTKRQKRVLEKKEKKAAAKITKEEEERIKDSKRLANSENIELDSTIEKKEPFWEKVITKIEDKIDDIEAKIDPTDPIEEAAILEANEEEKKNKAVRLTALGKDGRKTPVKEKMYTGSSTKRQADKHYDNLGYKVSTDYYKGLDAEISKDREAMARIANSYRLHQDTKNAEFWYARFINSSSEPEHALHYSQVLQSNEKCEKAMKWFNKYLDTAKKEEMHNRDRITNCKEIVNFKENKNVIIENLESLNSVHLDFTPAIFQDGIVFSSTRGFDRLHHAVDNWTAGNYADLFFARSDGVGGFEKPVTLKGKINGKYHDGTATFNEAGSFMVFTRNNTSGKSKDDLIDLKIYSAINYDGYWADVVELPFNSDEFSSCHPTLSSDGQRLYFASNRPGGYGGMDIWVSEAYGTSWKTPRNLGPDVNSAGNELFPFISVDDVLYFSSNAHAGLGGLDIFKSKGLSLNTVDTLIWTKPENIGKPFNSPVDDFGFIVNRKKNSGYFTSSRNGGKGKDDIYTWSLREGAMFAEDNFKMKEICIFNVKNDDKIENATITIIESEHGLKGKSTNDLVLTLKPVEDNSTNYLLGITQIGEEEMAATFKHETDAKGIFMQQIKPNHTYTLIIEKEGFDTKRMEQTYTELIEDESFCVSMEEDNCLRLKGLVKNITYNNYLPNAKITILNKCNMEEVELISDKNGRFDLCLDCACIYEITGSKNRFKKDIVTINTSDLDCETARLIEALLSLEVGTDEVKESNEKTIPIVTWQPVTTNVPVSQLTPEMLSAHFLGDKNKTFSKGQVLNVNDIYYDYDKFNIRPDASADLQKVIQLLKVYPKMEISLMSFTDSRGKNKYNKWLSNKRAEKAVDYIISEGISRSRIRAEGFGESQLVNKCGDGINCSEREHQENRRTEIKITKLEM